MLLIVGSYSDASRSGIHIYRMGTSYSFESVNSIAGIENPSYLHLSLNGRVYAVTENKEGSEGLLSIYDLPDSGKTMKLCSQIPYQGGGSCFITTDSAQNHAFIANYGSGSLTVMQLSRLSASAAIVQELRFSGHGSDAERQDKSHIHAAVLSKDGRFLYCTDLGTDRLYRFQYDPDLDTPLAADSIPYVLFPSGSGPRHLDFSKDGRWLYLVTELSGEIFVYDTQAWGGHWGQQISLAQEDFSGKMEGADIQVSPNGRYLYASNRGTANEIVVFQIDRLSGQLSFVQRIGAVGLSPRNLLLCENEGLLLSANEQSDNISVFRILANGMLEFTMQHLHVPAPTCLKVINR